MPITRTRGKHSSDISDYNVINILLEYLKINKTMTRKQFEGLFNITRYKASRLIKTLVEKKVIKNIGYKSHPVYTLND